jgi:WD40 repeat protein
VFSSDSRGIAFCRIREANCPDTSVWDLETGRRLQSFPNESEVPSDLAFSPDGRLLANASGGGSVQLWRVR